MDNPMNTCRPNLPRQSGAALVVAVVLLLLAGLLTLLALNIGVFEQRSTANDLRAKTVREVAEAGLAQGFEYLMRQHPSLLETGSWTKCQSNETTFPCGAVDEFEPDGSTHRRDTMYKWTGTGATISTASFDALKAYMLPLANTISTVGDAGGFPVDYGVAPLLCYVAPRPTGTDPTDPVRCTTREAASNQRVVTFVSVGSVRGESARTTLVQTVGRYNLFAGVTGVPPIIAAGSVDVTGGLQIVTNPNGGGTGVPVSVWTRKDVSKTGTPNTCYIDEFFRFGAKNNDPPTIYDGTTVCDTCQCEGDKSLSYDKSGNVQDEGIDILDVDGNTVGAYDPAKGINYDVNTTYPNCEFPPDLFAHVFGTAAWEDADHDCVGEVKIMTTYRNPNTGADVPMGADEAYLYKNAALVIHPTAATTNANLLRSDQVYTGAYPSASLGGLIWCQSNCDIGSNEQLGTPSNPVVLVIDGSGTTNIQGKVFGLVFLRTLAGGATLTPVAGYTMTSAEIASGGTASLRMNAGAVVYGSVVLQGKVDKANGTAAVVYNRDVLGNIEGPANDRFSTLPGAWNDKWSY